MITKDGKKKRTRLFDIEVDEISLVDAAAVDAGNEVGKNFFVFKRLKDDLENETIDLESLNPDEMETKLLEKFDSMSEEEQIETLDNLDFLLTKYGLMKIEESLEALKKADPFAYAELSDHPENFSIDEEDFTITRKANAIAPKPQKEWDPVNQRWVQKLG